MSEAPDGEPGLIKEFLLDLGASQDEIDEAVLQDQLEILAIERLLLPAGETFDRVELSRRTGMPLELSSRFWRALGFPDTPDTEPVFTELDVEAVSIVQGLLSLGLADVESAIQLGRVLGSSMARLAEAQVTMTQVREAGQSPAEAAENFALVADATLPSIARLIDYSWRRHLLAAARRAVLAGATQEEGTNQMQVDLTVGFADMVGFTVLSQQLSDLELGAVISRFESLAYDTVPAYGGRIVKMIGDEVMFVTDEPLAGAKIALALSEAHSKDEQLEDLRVGLAYGKVIARDGDYFGPIVNLASRIVDLARPGTILASSDYKEILGPGDRDGINWKPVRIRYIRGIGKVQVWSLRSGDLQTE